MYLKSHIEKLKPILKAQSIRTSMFIANTALYGEEIADRLDRNMHARKSEDQSK